MKWEVATVRKIVKSGKTRYISISTKLIPEGTNLVNLTLTPMSKDWGKRVVHLSKKMGSSYVYNSHKIIIPKSIVNHMNTDTLWIRITLPDKPYTDLFETFKLPYILEPKNLHYQESSYQVSISKTIIDYLTKPYGWTGELLVTVYINGDIITVLKKPWYNQKLNRYYVILPKNAINKILSNNMGEIRKPVMILPVPKEVPITVDQPDCIKILMETRK